MKGATRFPPAFCYTSYWLEEVPMTHLEALVTGIMIGIIITVAVFAFMGIEWRPQ